MQYQSVCWKIVSLLMRKRCCWKNKVTNSLAFNNLSLDDWMTISWDSHIVIAKRHITLMGMNGKMLFHIKINFLKVFNNQQALMHVLVSAKNGLYWPISWIQNSDVKLPLHWETFVMCEYHIDAISDDHNTKKSNSMNVLAILMVLAYITKKSIQLHSNDLPLMITCYDKCVFSLFLLNPKCGQVQIRKDPSYQNPWAMEEWFLGCNPRILVWVCQWTWISWHKSTLHMLTANHQYIDEAAVMEIYHNISKPHSPFYHSYVV